MPATITIADNGGSIRLSVGSLERNISKLQIAEVTIVKGDLLKIDMGLGALKNIYIQHSDVISPLTSTPLELRDTILTMLIVGGGGGNSTATATEGNQIIGINLLTALQTAISIIGTRVNYIYENIATVASDLVSVKSTIADHELLLISIAGQVNANVTRTNLIYETVNTLSANLASLLNNMTELNTTVTESYVTVDAMSQMVNAIDGRSANTETKVGVIDSRTYNIQDLLSTLNSTSNNTNTTVAGINTKVNYMYDTVGTIGTNVSNLGVSVGTLNTNVNSLNTAVGSLSTKVNTINDTVGTMNTNLNTVNTNSSNTNTTVNSLNTAVGSLTTKVNTLSTTVDGLATNNTSVNSTLATMNTNINSLNTAVGSIDGRLLYGPLIVDDSSSEYTYKGYATINTSQGAFSWAIERVSKLGTTQTHVWAGGARTFVNRWSDRSILTYS